MGTKSELLASGRILGLPDMLNTSTVHVWLCVNQALQARFVLRPEENGAEHYRDHVSPRPSMKINSKLATAAVAIHAPLCRIGPTCFSSLRLLFGIMKGRLNRPAFAPKVDGRADAMT